MKDRLEQELETVVFEGKKDVLNKIKLKENQPSWLSRVLNYEVKLPVPVVAVGLSIVLIVSIINYNDRTIDYDPIYVIHEGGEYEVY